MEESDLKAATARRVHGYLTREYQVADSDAYVIVAANLGEIGKASAAGRPTFSVGDLIAGREALRERDIGEPRVAASREGRVTVAPPRARAVVRHLRPDAQTAAVPRGREGMGA